MSNFRLSLDFIPNDVINLMTGLEQRVARTLFRLIMFRKEVCALEYAYVTPPLTWIADQCNTSESVVSRIVKRLEQHGIISVIRRRKANGEYTINKYSIGTLIHAILKRFTDKKKGNKITQLTSMSKVLNKEPQEDNYFTECMSFLKEKFGKRKTTGLQRAL